MSDESRWFYRFVHADGRLRHPDNALDPAGIPDKAMAGWRRHPNTIVDLPGLVIVSLKGTRSLQLFIREDLVE